MCVCARVLPSKNGKINCTENKIADLYLALKNHIWFGVNYDHHIVVFALAAHILTYALQIA